MRRRVGVVGTSRSVSMSVFYVSSEARVSRVTKKHEKKKTLRREKHKKERYSVTMHIEKTGVT